jgi:hypothetical protein
MLFESRPRGRRRPLSGVNARVSGVNARVSGVNAHENRLRLEFSPICPMRKLCSQEYAPP